MAWATSVRDVPLGWTVAWIAGTGLLPVTAACYAHRRSPGWGAPAARIGAVTGAALLLAVIGGFLQKWTGWHAYEPPRLDRSRYVGDWIGGGAYRLRLRLRLRLDENGRAEAGRPGTHRATGSPSRPGAAVPSATGRRPARPTPCTAPKA
jgi:hypothetical protein